MTIDSSKLKNDFKKMMPIKSAIFASGNGSNAQNLIEFAKENPSKLKIECLICDKKDAYVLERAKKFNIPYYLIPITKEVNKVEQEKKILKVLNDHNIYFVLLAGYMRILSPQILNRFNNTKEKGYIFNIHPSLLPDFKGAHGFKDAFESNVKYSGITIHLVNEELDSGKILLQEKFERYPNDTFEDFYNRGRLVESTIYKKAINMILEDEIIL